MTATAPPIRLESPEDKWFRSLAETTSAAIVVYRGQRILYANSAAESLTGYRLAELQQLDGIGQLVAPQDRLALLEQARALLRGDPLSYPPFRIVRKDGEERWIELSASRIRFAGFTAALSTAIDVTEHRRTELVLHRQVAFEQLILEISKQFLSLSARQLDEGITIAFRILGESSAIDRLAFFRYQGRPERYTCQYEWRRRGIASRLANRCSLRADDFPWAIKRLSRRELLHVPRLTELPAEAHREKRAALNDQLRSFLCLPVFHQESMLGILVCDSVRREYSWSDQRITLLRIFSEILAGALARRETEEALLREEERAQVTLASIGDGVIRTDAMGRIDFLNPVAEQLTGWRLQEARGREVEEVYHVVGEATRRPRRNPLEMCLAERRTIVSPGLYTLHGRHGDEHTIRDSVSPILDRGGDLAGTVLVFRDLTRMRGLERDMAYMASHDALTGLLNRSEFEIYLEAALESARERRARHVLLVLDLLQFRLVNECFGHVAGDELLRQIASLIRVRIGSGNAACRLSGDQFAALLENCTSAQARSLASDLLSELREFRFSWAGQLFDIDAVIGLVPITAKSDSVVQLLKTVDTACDLARDSGRNKIHVYVPEDEALAERSGRLQWVHRIRRALAEDRFRLFHQKIHPIGGDDEPALHEILVRLVDDAGDLVLPSKFIPIAEDANLAPLLDRWVLRQSLKVMASGHGSPLEDNPVSINLSGQSLSDDGFLDFVIEQLKISGVLPERIFFEITETAAVANLTRALRFIEALRKVGCRFILDDFGSGLCSFAYLKNLPVHLLKIDGEFVRGMDQDPIHRAMVESINQIGQVMGLATIAEWVETEETYELLRDLRVDYVQGYWIHRPEPLVNYR